ncbi:MAG: 1-deoxy-D-xylulose-5-phosphate reductoisomerase [Deltaproteobacteria bacterium]|nr:1-deoxy-D-xylulose-5-phosphate reductoisomerase [Deltaproteobacteria bacterium]
MKKISLLGSTGSIGTSTLDVVRKNPDRFQIVALACGRNIKLVIDQIREFKPESVSVQNPQDIPVLQEALGAQAPRLFSGEEGSVQVATHPEAHLVVSAIVGAAGLVPTLAGIRARKEIALANKETMVIAGELMNREAQANQVKILPVDSEHNAIFQALQGHQASDVRRMILTASGGPFREKSLEELKTVTVDQALKHPNWSMGPKITIDSASLMNKGLELIEARWLFEIPPEKIEVHVHPQSVVHSMVEYHDGSVIAQLGIPDMRIPIAYALSYPERIANDLPALNLFQVQNLSFYKPDLERFPCLKLAQQALSRGGTAPCVLNASNEIAVAAFLEKEIQFLEIAEMVAAVLKVHDLQDVQSLDQLIRVDAWAREEAKRWIKEERRQSMAS